jgi:hypothetical protein
MKPLARQHDGRRPKDALPPRTASGLESHPHGSYGKRPREDTGRRRVDAIEDCRMCCLELI